MRWFFVLPVVGVILSSIYSEAAVLPQNGRVEVQHHFNPRNARQTEPTVGTSAYAAASYPSNTYTQTSLYGAVPTYGSQARYGTPTPYDYTLNDYLVNSYTQPTSYYSPQSSYAYPAPAPSSYYTPSNALASYATPKITTTYSNEDYEKTTPVAYTSSSSPHLASQVPSTYTTKLASAAEAFRLISECLQIKLQAAERLEQAENEFIGTTSPFARNAADAPYVSPSTTTTYNAPQPINIVENVDSTYVAPSPSPSYNPAPAPYVAGRAAGGVTDIVGEITKLLHVARNANPDGSLTPYTAPVTYTAPQPVDQVVVDPAPAYVAPSSSYVAPSSTAYPSAAAAAPYITGRAGAGDLVGLVTGLLGLKGRGKGGDDVVPVYGNSVPSSDSTYAQNQVGGDYNSQHLDRVLSGVLGYSGTHGRAHGGGEGHQGGGGGHHGRAHGHAFEEIFSSPYDEYIDGTTGYGDPHYEEQQYNDNYQGSDSSYDQKYI